MASSRPQPPAAPAPAGEVCPQAPVRAVLRATRRLFVLGFSTTGGGHERLTAVLVELLGGEESLQGVTVLVSMPEPWKGEMLADGSVPEDWQHRVDHTRSVLQKLSPLVERGCQLALVRALKSVVGFYTVHASAAAVELMWEMVVARPEAYRGEEARRLLCERGFVLLDEARRASFSWEDLERSLMPTARSLMGVLLAETAGDAEIVVITDMDPNLTSAALKTRASMLEAGMRPPRVRCLDYENHQDLLLHTFGIASVEDVAAYKADFERVTGYHWNQPELFSTAPVATVRKLVRAAFLVKVLNMGREGLWVAHVDIVDPAFRRMNRSDLELYAFATDRRAAVRFLLRHGRRITAEQAGTAHEGIIHAEGAAEESIRHILYVYAHLSGRSILEYYCRHIGEHRDVLVVGCGKGWHRHALLDAEALEGRTNVMRICQLAQGHGIITAGAGACGELSDMLYTFDAPVGVVIPLDKQHEQQHNGETMRGRFGERLLVGTRGSGFDIAQLGPFLGDFARRMDAAQDQYLPPAAALAASRRLLAKRSAAEHAARLLAGVDAPTPKEELIHAFSELLRTSGMFLHLKVLRRHLKGFFQLADQLDTLAARRTASARQLFTINECARCTGKRVTVVGLAQADARVRELRHVFKYLGAPGPLHAACEEAWAALLGSLGLDLLEEGSREELLPGVSDDMPTGLVEAPDGPPMSAEQLALLGAVARAMMRLAESASELFITGF